MRYKQYCPICSNVWYTWKKPFVKSYDITTGKPLYRVVQECKKCNKKIKEL